MGNQTHGLSQETTELLEGLEAEYDAGKLTKAEFERIFEQVRGARRVSELKLSLAHCAAHRWHPLRTFNGARAAQRAAWDAPVH